MQLAGDLVPRDVAPAVLLHGLQRRSGPGPGLDDRGHALGFATGTDGGAPPPVTSAVGPQAEVEVVASGGVGTLDHIRTLADLDRTAPQETWSTAVGLVRMVDRLIAARQSQKGR